MSVNTSEYFHLVKKTAAGNTETEPDRKCEAKQKEELKEAEKINRVFDRRVEEELDD